MSEDQENKEPEELEEIVEEDEVEDTDISDILERDTSEIDRILLSRFLSQTNQGVSLDQRDIAPTVDLESDLGQQELNTQNLDDAKPISYMPGQDEEEITYTSGPASFGIDPKQRLDLTPAERIVQDKKDFTKRSFGFGSEKVENLEGKYLVMETKDPSKDYIDHIKEVN